MPVIVSTITTIIVFFPVVFLTGLGRFLFSPLALSVAFAMAASYVFAMTLAPAYCFRFLREGQETNREGWLTIVAARLERIRETYERLLTAALARRRAVLIASGVLFAIAVTLLPQLGRELFPAIDAGQFTILVRAPSGTRIESSENLASRVESAVRQVIAPREVHTIVTNSGVLYDWPAAYTPNSGPMDTFVSVQLSEDHQTSAQEYVGRLRTRLSQEFPSVSFAYDTGGLMTAALNFGLPSPIDIQVTGNSLEAAQKIASEIQEQVQTVPGTTDVRIQQKLDYPELKVDVDRVKAAYLGLDADDVVKNLLTALNSSTTFSPAFWVDEKNGNHYFVGAQYPETIINSFQTLENVPITGATTNGENARLSLLKNVATIGRGTSPLEVEHRNIVRVTDVYANVSGRDIASVSRDVQNHLDKIQLPPGYHVYMRGEAASMKESFSGLGFGLLMAIALVYLVLVAQFRSFTDPLVILLAVPLGLLGVIGILLLTGTTVNIQSYLGTIFMVGIAVSNSVLLVEFANRLRDGGLPLHEAVVKASGIRLRPILMTSVAAIAGLLPMAIQMGTGAEANVPLARAVVGGLAASTLLTLFVVPVIYLAINQRKGPRFTSPEAVTPPE